jgi:hypothetical protein
MQTDTRVSYMTSNHYLLYFSRVIEHMGPLPQTNSRSFERSCIGYNHLYRNLPEKVIYVYKRSRKHLRTSVKLSVQFSRKGAQKKMQKVMLLTEIFQVTQ